MGRTFTVVACVSLVGALAVSAADVPVAAKKLIVVDKSALIGKAKIVYVAKDPAITKGAGTDVAMIDVVFDLAYAGVGSVAGAFVVPPGGSNGTDGWRTRPASPST